MLVTGSVILDIVRFLLSKEMKESPALYWYRAAVLLEITKEIWNLSLVFGFEDQSDQITKEDGCRNTGSSTGKAAGKCT